ncbi:MAG: Kef-type K+ transport system [Thermodesulfobacterium sp.]|uniref:Kef-type K+ transport system n=1 Tax=Candidatus Thermodesulfobacterium syntrophicum TaxID=3060442 RepID=A0AAE3P2T3_9BACT|nr:Kef-type K+ transport system [Candidatus Thermodesulfobacterium syntrophicum]
MLFELLKSFLIIFVFAIIISSIFIRFKISPVIGFLLTGIIVGPSALGLIQDYHLIETFAEFGVIFLMFIIGVEFSIKKLIAYRKEILIVGLIQVVLTILTVTLITLFFLKKSLSTGIFFGSLVAMSSTALVLKILMDRGELTTSYGRVCFGILIFQDLCVILIMLLIPILGGKKGSIIDIFFILGKSLAILSCAFIAGLYIFPLIFHQIVKTRSRELFLMTILVLSLGTAFFSYKLGLSLALGAFLAGIVISESEYALQTIAEIKPIKDLLMAIFFISVGLLLKPYFIFSNLKLTVLTILLILLIKISTAFLSALIVSKNLRISLLTGLILAQTGEFSLVLALEGKKFGIIEEKWYQIFIGSSIVTLFLTPFLIEWSHKLTDYFLEKISHKSYLKLKRRREKKKKEEKTHLSDHTIVVGYGIGGQNIVYGLKTLNIPYVIVDLNPNTVKIYKKKGEPIFFGDATNVEILRKLGIQNAKALVIVIGDNISARKITLFARKENPNLYIIVRTRFVAEIEDFVKLGANEVIPEEFEASIEIFAKVLHYYKVPRNVILDLLESIRKNHYKAFRTPVKPLLTSIENLEFLREVVTETYLVKKESPLVGLTLKALDLRSKTGATIIAIKRNEEFIVNPSPNLTFKENDILILIGTETQLNTTLAFLENPISFSLKQTSILK